MESDSSSSDLLLNSKTESEHEALRKEVFNGIASLLNDPRVPESIKYKLLERDLSAASFSRQEI